MFKKGDVVVMNEAPEDVDEWPSFVEEMEEFLGTPMTVTGSDPYGQEDGGRDYCGVYVEENTYTWKDTWFEESNGTRYEDEEI